MHSVFRMEKKFSVSAFAGCTGLTEINIPDSMTDVPRSIFKDAPLTTVYIGKGVKTLSPDTFNKGTADFASGLYFKEKVLENLVVDSENPYFSAIGTMLLSQDGKVLIAELGDPEVAEIPEGVEEIGPQAFEKIGSFAEVRFPSTLKKIGEKAFAGTALTHVEFPLSAEHRHAGLQLLPQPQRRGILRRSADHCAAGFRRLSYWRCLYSRFCYHSGR